MKHARADYARIQDPAGLIPKDEPVFLIRGQDIVGFQAVRAWAHYAMLAGASQQIVQMAVDQASKMEAWAQKVPDLRAQTEASGPSLLREGDRVCGAGTVREGRIVWDAESVSIDAPALAIGDRVSWHSRGAVERDFGRVLAVDPDEDNPGRSYVWIRQEGKWPRITMLSSELQRHG